MGTIGRDETRQGSKGVVGTARRQRHRFLAVLRDTYLALSVLLDQLVERVAVFHPADEAGVVAAGSNMAGKGRGKGSAWRHGGAADAVGVVFGKLHRARGSGLSRARRT